jgi:hypothetical protein
MPLPSLNSPNPGNYQVGKGIVSFKKEGEGSYRDMGNVAELTLTPDMTTLEHYSSREGTKKKDLVIILEKKAALKIVMEEYTAQNLALMLLGSVDEDAVGGPEVQIFDQAAVSGALRFVGTNEVGPRVTWDLYNVTFTPTGDLGFISDEFGQMEATADVLAAGGVQPVYATGVYTATLQLEDADTLVIGGKTYTLQTTLTNVDGNVKIGVNLAATLANLASAINLTGTAGTDYAAAMGINASVSATSDATKLYLTAKSPVAATGNAVTTTDTSDNGAFGGGVLSGGVDGDVNAGKFGLLKITNVEPAS